MPLVRLVVMHDGAVEKEREPVDLAREGAVANVQNEAAALIPPLPL